MELKLKIHYTKSFVIRILWQLFIDLKDYYLNPYPFLMIRGAVRRIRKRLKVIWFPRGRGRPIHKSIKLNFGVTSFLVGDVKIFDTLLGWQVNMNDSKLDPRILTFIPIMKSLSTVK